MTTANTVSPTLREPQLLGQTVVVIGGSFWLSVCLKQPTERLYEGLRVPERPLRVLTFGRGGTLWN